MKRELEQLDNFSTLTAFQIMDVKGFKYLDWESLYLFLKAGGKISQKKHINALFRRLDINADAKLTFGEFAEAIKPIDVYCCTKTLPDWTKS